MPAEQLRPCSFAWYAMASLCYDANSRSESLLPSFFLGSHDSSSHLTASRILSSTCRHRPTKRHSSDLPSGEEPFLSLSSRSLYGRYALNIARFV
jgi:hypothetical protein